MRDFMRLLPWIISVVALSLGVVNTVIANYDVAIWCWVAFVGWLTAATSANR